MRKLATCRAMKAQHTPELGDVAKAVWATGIALGLSVAWAPGAVAAEYPERAVTIMVGYAAGGPSDAAARIVGEALSTLWNQPVVIENRPGATATLATAQVTKAKADGYTLLMAANDLVSSRFTYAKLPYDPDTALAPVGLVVQTPNVLVVPDASPIRSVSDLVETARRQPEKYSYSSTGSGSTSHLAAEIFVQKTGVKINHIPYKGFAQALPDLLGGRIDLSFPSLTSVMEQIRAGKLRAIAVATVQRSALLPNTPTFAQAGIPDYRVRTWYGIMAPSQTPKEIIQRVNADLRKVLTQPEVQKKMLALGSEASPTTPSEFEALIRDEVKVTATLASKLQLADK